MKKKIIIILIFLLLSVLLFSGCQEKNGPVNDKSLAIIDNLPPVAKISAQVEAFYGETIEFDASKSYDSDGTIVSYTWDFDDGNTAEGKIVEHTYTFEKEFNIEYPLIYTVILYVTDDEFVSAIDHQISIYPNEFIFYLDSQGLIANNPSSNKESVNSTGLLKIGFPREISYDLDASVTIQKCDWNMVLCLEKPLLTWVNKLSLFFYDGQDNEIVEEEFNLGLNYFWREKTVEITGSFDKEFEFSSVKIRLHGFLIGGKINILYGGEKASKVCFNF